jgi:hypothetical protein
MLLTPQLGSPGPPPGLPRILWGKRDFLVVSEGGQHGSHDDRQCARQRVALR